jgi:hypothetical protein
MQPTYPHAAYTHSVQQFPGQYPNQFPGQPQYADAAVAVAIPAQNPLVMPIVNEDAPPRLLYQNQFGQTYEVEPRTTIFGGTVLIIRGKWTWWRKLWMLIVVATILVITVVLFLKR